MHIPKSETGALEIEMFDAALQNALLQNPNYDVNRWLFVPNHYDEYRYILGTRGKNPLICYGINPSTAAPDDLDNTLKSAERIALFNGFDSFIMLNVYAQRATNPDDMETALADYCRRTRQPVPTRRGETVRCIFESLALRYRQVMENLRALSPHAVNTLHVIGGGSRNPLLNQYTANALQMPVVAGPAEATAIGNVMMQAIAAGMAANVAEMRSVLAAGTALQRYLPRDAERWNEAYMRYTERTRQTN